MAKPPFPQVFCGFSWHFSGKPRFWPDFGATCAKNPLLTRLSALIDLPESAGVKSSPGDITKQCALTVQPSARPYRTRLFRSRQRRVQKIDHRCSQSKSLFDLL